MSGSLICFIWIVWSIALLVFYHKIFTVYYFSVSRGIIKELMISAFLGVVMTILTLHLWFVAAIILVIAGIVAKYKTYSLVPLVLAIIAAVVVSAIGIQFRSETKNNQRTAASTYSVDTYSEDDECIIFETDIIA